MENDPGSAKKSEPSKNAVLKKFGRYLLLDKLAEGGMASIFRARLATNDGISRIQVIKRIQDHFSRDPNYLRMFRSEIKVAMGFNHPNVIQTYDYGEVDGRLFIAMEWVDGKNLREVLNRFKGKLGKLPVEFTVHVIEQVAAGLHYAHQFKDKISGQELSVIHRDVSPQNILIAYDGQVKIIDFGIVKSEVNEEKTQMGTIKGKPSYFAPEQAMGHDDLDHRTDQFALAVVLWEMLVGRKLFTAENDMKLIRMIESCSSHVQPPSTVEGGVGDPDLDKIVMRALSRDKEKRFKDCDELARELRNYLKRYRPDFNPSLITDAMKQYFKDELVQEIKVLKDLSARADAILAEEGEVLSEKPQDLAEDPDANREDTTTLYRSKGSAGAAQVAPSAPAPVRGSREVVKAVPSGAPVPQVDLQSRPAMARPTGTRSSISVNRPAEPSGGSAVGKVLLLVGALAGVLLVGPEYGIEIPGVDSWVAPYRGFVAQFLGKRKTFRIELNGPQTEVDVYLDGVLQPGLSRIPGFLDIEFQDKKMSRLMVKAKQGGGTFIREIPHTLVGDVVAQNVEFSNRVQRIGMRLDTLPIRLDPKVSKVVVNGQLAEFDGSQVVKVPVDQPLTFEISHPGFQTLRSERSSIPSQTVEAGQTLAQEFELVPDKYGSVRLTLNVTLGTTVRFVMKKDGREPSSGGTLEFEFDAEKVKDRKLPVGEYRVYAFNKGLEREGTIENLRVDSERATYGTLNLSDPLSKTSH